MLSRVQVPALLRLEKFGADGRRGLIQMIRPKTSVLPEVFLSQHLGDMSGRLRTRSNLFPPQERTIAFDRDRLGISPDMPICSIRRPWQVADRISNSGDIKARWGRLGVPTRLPMIIARLRFWGTHNERHLARRRRSLSRGPSLYGAA